MTDWLILGAMVAVAPIVMMFLFATIALFIKATNWTNPISKILIIGFSILNATYNMTLAMLLCLDPPGRFGEPTTKRLQRYKRIYSKDSKGLNKWRWNIAMAVCWWLNKFDKGHC